MSRGMIDYLRGYTLDKKAGLMDRTLGSCMESCTIAELQSCTDHSGFEVESAVKTALAPTPADQPTIIAPKDRARQTCRVAFM